MTQSLIDTVSCVVTFIAHMCSATLSEDAGVPAILLAGL